MKPEDKPKRPAHRPVTIDPAPLKEVTHMGDRVPLIEVIWPELRADRVVYL